MLVWILRTRIVYKKFSPVPDFPLPSDVDTPASEVFIAGGLYPFYEGPQNRPDPGLRCPLPHLVLPVLSIFADTQLGQPIFVHGAPPGGRFFWIVPRGCLWPRIRLATFPCGFPRLLADVPLPGLRPSSFFLADQVAPRLAAPRAALTCSSKMHGTTEMLHHKSNENGCFSGRFVPSVRRPSVRFFHIDRGVHFSPQTPYHVALRLHKTSFLSSFKKWTPF